MPLTFIDPRITPEPVSCSPLLFAGGVAPRRGRFSRWTCQKERRVTSNLIIKNNEGQPVNGELTEMRSRSPQGAEAHASHTPLYPPPVGYSLMLRLQQQTAGRNFPNPLSQISLLYLHSALHIWLMYFHSNTVRGANILNTIVFGPLLPFYIACTWIYFNPFGCICHIYLVLPVNSVNIPRKILVLIYFHSVLFGFCCFLLFVLSISLCICGSGGSIKYYWFKYL